MYRRISVLPLPVILQDVKGIVKSPEGAEFFMLSPDGCLLRIKENQDTVLFYKFAPLILIIYIYV